jgi:hypothetical protein
MTMFGDILVVTIWLGIDRMPLAASGRYMPEMFIPAVMHRAAQSKMSTVLSLRNPATARTQD